MPHPGGLTQAEGGFTTALGWFGARWTISNNVVQLSVTAPAGTKGVVRLPGVTGNVTVDGKMGTAGAITVQGGQEHVLVGRVA